MAWKAIARFCAGTKHQKRNIECQDYAAWELLKDCAIAGVVSDGAGCAKYAAQGAEIAVKTAISSIKRSFEQLNPVLFDTSSLVQYRHQPLLFVSKLCRWFFSLFGFKNTNQVRYIREISDSTTREIFNLALEQVRLSLQQQALKQQCSIDEFACTLLAFIATPCWIAAMQIGDGFIVVRQPNNNYQLLFQPQKGEFINEVAFFVTSHNVKDEMKVQIFPGKHKFICVSTDGLELVSIRFRDFQPYKPFFQPFEEYMETIPDPEQETDIEDFLNSEQVNRRTNDDKTLLLCFYDEQSKV